jgi:hypothetical protein
MVNSMPMDEAVAYTDTCAEPMVLTSDPADLTALAAHARRRITVART